jgi:hypothetical protein
MAALSLGAWGLCVIWDDDLDTQACLWRRCPSRLWRSTTSSAGSPSWQSCECDCHSSRGTTGEVDSPSLTPSQMPRRPLEHHLLWVQQSARKDAETSFARGKVQADETAKTGETGPLGKSTDTRLSPLFHASLPTQLCPVTPRPKPE